MVVSLDAWGGGEVAPTRHTIRVEKRRDVALLPVSPRRKGVQLIHPDRDSTVWRIFYSADGKRIIGGNYPEGTLQVWDAGTGQQLTRIATGYESRGSVDYFHVTPDFRRVFAVNDEEKAERFEKDGEQSYRWTFGGKVRAWDLDTGEVLRTYQHDPPHGCLAMYSSPKGGHFVTMDAPPGVAKGRPKYAPTLWDVRTGGHRGLGDGVVSYGPFAPDGKSFAAFRLVEGEHAREMLLFDTAGTVRSRIPIAEPKAWGDAQAFSPDGRLVAGHLRAFEKRGDVEIWYDVLKLWDVAGGKELASYRAEEDEIGAAWMAFSPDGKRLMAIANLSAGRELRFYDVAGRCWTHKLRLGDADTWIRRAAFSPDGNLVAALTQKIPKGSGAEDHRDFEQPRIHLIDPSTGEVKETIAMPQCFGFALAFSPDGRTLASNGPGRVLLWDVSDLTE